MQVNQITKSGYLSPERIMGQQEGNNEGIILQTAYRNNNNRSTESEQIAKDSVSAQNSLSQSGFPSNGHNCLSAAYINKVKSSNSVDSNKNQFNLDRQNEWRPTLMRQSKNDIRADSTTHDQAQQIDTNPMSMSQLEIDQQTFQQILLLNQQNSKSQKNSDLVGNFVGTSFQSGSQQGSPVKGTTNPFMILAQKSNSQDTNETAELGQEFKSIALNERIKKQSPVKRKKRSKKGKLAAEQKQSPSEDSNILAELANASLIEGLQPVQKMQIGFTTSGQMGRYQMKIHSGGHSPIDMGKPMPLGARTAALKLNSPQSQNVNIQLLKVQEYQNDQIDPASGLQEQTSKKPMFIRKKSQSPKVNDLPKQNLKNQSSDNGRNKKTNSVRDDKRNQGGLNEESFRSEIEGKASNDWSSREDQSKLLTDLLAKSKYEFQISKQKIVKDQIELSQLKKLEEFVKQVPGKQPFQRKVVLLELPSKREAANCSVEKGGSSNRRSQSPTLLSSNPKNVSGYILAQKRKSQQRKRVIGTKKQSPQPHIQMTSQGFEVKQMNTSQNSPEKEVSIASGDYKQKPQKEDLDAFMRFISQSQEFKNANDKTEKTKAQHMQIVSSREFESQKQKLLVDKSRNIQERMNSLITSQSPLEVNPMNPVIHKIKQKSICSREENIVEVQNTEIGTVSQYHQNMSDEVTKEYQYSPEEIGKAITNKDLQRTRIKLMQFPRQSELGKDEKQFKYTHCTFSPNSLSNYHHQKQNQNKGQQHSIANQTDGALSHFSQDFKFINDHTMDDDQNSKEDEQQKFENLMKKQGLLPQKFFHLLEQSRIQNQDFKILKAKPVELQIGDQEDSLQRNSQEIKESIYAAKDNFPNVQRGMVEKRRLKSQQQCFRQPLKILSHKEPNQISRNPLEEFDIHNTSMSKSQRKDSSKMSNKRASYRAPQGSRLQNYSPHCSLIVRESKAARYCSAGMSSHKKQSQKSDKLSNPDYSESKQAVSRSYQPVTVNISCNALDSNNQNLNSTSQVAAQTEEHPGSISPPATKMFQGKTVIIREISDEGYLFKDIAAQRHQESIQKVGETCLRQDETPHCGSAGSSPTFVNRDVDKFLETKIEARHIQAPRDTIPQFKMVLQNKNTLYKCSESDMETSEQSQFLKFKSNNYQKFLRQLKNKNQYRNKSGTAFCILSSDSRRPKPEKAMSRKMLNQSHNFREKPCALIGFGAAHLRKSEDYREHNPKLLSRHHKSQQAQRKSCNTKQEVGVTFFLQNMKNISRPNSQVDGPLYNEFLLKSHELKSSLLQSPTQLANFQFNRSSPQSQLQDFRPQNLNIGISNVKVNYPSSFGLTRPKTQNGLLRHHGGLPRFVKPQSHLKNGTSSILTNQLLQDNSEPQVQNIMTFKARGKSRATNFPQLHGSDLSKFDLKVMKISSHQN